MDDRCATCDRPPGPPRFWWTDLDFDPGHYCWAESLDCDGNPVDWRTRALSAEADLATARELVSVLEERADALAAEVEDREARIEAMRAVVGAARAIRWAWRDHDKIGKWQEFDAALFRYDAAKGGGV